MRLVRGWMAAAAAALCVSAAASADAGPDTLELTNGDVLHGTIVQWDDKVVIIEHDELGRLEIPRDQIKTYTRLTPDGPVTEPPPPPKTEIDYWDVAVDLSFTSASGNTDEQSLRFGANASRITDKTKLLMDFSYYWAATDGATTDNKATLGARNDWLLPESKWFWFVSGRFDYDAFQSWTERVNAQVGPGYHLIENDNLILDVYGGLGGRKEWGSTDDGFKFEGVAGVDLAWTPTGRQSVTFSFQYFPVMTDIQNFRTRSTAQWRYVLDEAYSLSLIVGYLWEYQSMVDPGMQRNDFRIWIGIQYGF